MEPKIGQPSEPIAELSCTEVRKVVMNRGYCGSQVMITYPPTNEEASESLVRKLQRELGIIDKYDKIIQEQLTEEIVKRVVDEPNKRVFTSSINS
ncbi:hypothetical protein OS493_036585 [Desmophyllum pertusum]|uniref:Uncharacterized protein n=1 Tax=Desmophyllum pertusum TaxID=174260 RepID=A0A9X0D8B6_9CNID|nr:hypothetical protein OS493_036585 [Desmophyllum pertusum]